MIDVYKFLSGKYDKNCSVKLQLCSCRGSASGVETRGNLYKLVPDRSKYEHRIVSVWNSLPDSVVSAESVNSFKSRLDKFRHAIHQSFVRTISCVRTLVRTFVYFQGYSIAGKRGQSPMAAWHAPKDTSLSYLILSYLILSYCCADEIL